MAQWLESIFIPALLDQRRNCRIHFDLDRPAARMPVLRAFGCGIDADLAAKRIAHGRMIELIDCAFDNRHVALPIDVAQGTPRDFTQIVNVDILVDDDDALRQHQ